MMISFNKSQNRFTSLDLNLFSKTFSCYGTISVQVNFHFAVTDKIEELFIKENDFYKSDNDSNDISLEINYNCKYNSVIRYHMG